MDSVGTKGDDEFLLAQLIKQIIPEMKVRRTIFLIFIIIVSR